MDTLNLSDLVRAIVYSLTGFFLFLLCFFITVRVIPFDIWKEVRDNRNVAAGLLLGAACVAVAIIIAAAVH